MDKPKVFKGILVNTPLVQEAKHKNDWKHYSKIFYDSNMTVQFPKTCMHDLPEYKLSKDKKGSHWLFEQTNDLAFVCVRSLPEKIKKKLDLRSLPPVFHHLYWKWLANNKPINSGLHFDVNGGGYLGVLTGKKEVILMPPDSVNYLPMLDGDSRHRSTLFAWNYIDANTTHPSFQHLKMYKITVEKGDMLYIPHGWFHEVKSSPETVAIAGWVIDRDMRFYEDILLFLALVVLVVVQILYLHLA